MRFYPGLIKEAPEILFIRAFSSGAKAKDDDNFACRILDDLVLLT